MVNPVAFKPGDVFEGVTVDGPLPATGDLQAWEVTAPEGPGILYCVYRRGRLPPSQIEAFKARAAKLADVSDPHLPPIRGYGYSGPHRCLWLLTEALPKGAISLRYCYEKTRRLGLPIQHFAVFASLARALADASDAGFHHYMLTPDRVYIGEGFSLSRVTHLGLIEVFDVPAPHPTYDTIAYIEPNFLRGERGSQADIYALGMILWEMTARRRPYLESGSARIDVDEAFIQGLERTRLPSLDGLKSTSLPEFVIAFVERVAAKQTSARPADWDAMLEEIEAVATAWFPSLGAASKKEEALAPSSAAAPDGAAPSTGAGWGDGSASPPSEPAPSAGPAVPPSELAPSAGPAVPPSEPAPRAGLFVPIAFGMLSTFLAIAAFSFGIAARPPSSSALTAQPAPPAPPARPVLVTVISRAGERC
jgi:serine/threonine protein kinase